ncbi:TPA: hypothetical protein ACS3AC_000971 [Klebsiella pneumoniae]|nr:hypothetical protein [Klebsiella pneumoniae]HDY4998487.1 hypothetical protein [Klebsiella pneumoniae]
MKQDYFAYEELLMGMFGISDDDYESTDFDELTYEHFEVSFEQFAGIVDALLPHTPVVNSTMTGKNYHAFLKGNMAIIKIEVSG